MSKRKRLLWKILSVLTVLALLFIFSNSLQSDFLVGQRKGRVMKAVETVLEWPTGRDIVFEAAHRVMFAKIGHVLEYCLFSALFTVAVLLPYGENRKDAFYRIFYCCAFVALADEHLQTLGVGRSPSLTDSIVDLAACYIGYGAGYVFLLLYGRRQNRIREKA